MKVIAICGKRGSGKDTIAEYISKKYGFKMLTYTNDVLGPLLKKEGKKITRENLIKLALDLRKKIGNDAPTKLMCEKMKRLKHNKYVISGIRYPEEVKRFRNEFGSDFVLIAVICDTKTRYERLIKRNDKGESKLTYKEFLEIDKKAETETMIDEIIPVARFLVDNNGTEKELYKNIDLLMKEILKD